MVWPCLTFLNLCVGRAMPGLTLYVFACMLHCNGLAMPDLLKLGVGRAMPGFTFMCLFTPHQPPPQVFLRTHSQFHCSQPIGSKSILVSIMDPDIYPRYRRSWLGRLFDSWRNVMLGIRVSHFFVPVPKRLPAAPLDDVCVTPEQLWPDTDDGF